MEETWKPVKGYEGFYEVSNLGRVKSLERVVMLGYERKGKRLYPEAILRAADNMHGYLQVNLCINSKPRMSKVHRLVAEAFLPNPNNYPQVNHINAIKTDNRPENLEWCNNSMNQLHASSLGLKSKPVLISKTFRPVAMFDLSGNRVGTFRSMAEAARYLKCRPGAVSDVIYGIKQSVKKNVVRDINPTNSPKN
jgi:hypothetical protein